MLVTSSPSLRCPAGGRPISTGRLNEGSKAAAYQAGIKNFTIHSLRRFFNTTCVNAGLPEHVVRLWIGHHDRSMTGLYYHLGDEESRRFMDSVSSELANRDRLRDGSLIQENNDEEELEHWMVGVAHYPGVVAGVSRQRRIPGGLAG